MQDREHAFERAVNERNLGVLGDPERWGGSTEVSLAVPTGIASDESRFSAQFVRAQCADLVTRAWDFISFWELANLAPGDGYTLALEVICGSGQSSGRGELALTSNIIGPALIQPPWIVTQNRGVVHLLRPIPACAIAVRARLQIVAAGADPAHTVVGRCTALIAPRSL